MGGFVVGLLSFFFNLLLVFLPSLTDLLTAWVASRVSSINWTLAFRNLIDRQVSETQTVLPLMTLTTRLAISQHPQKNSSGDRRVDLMSGGVGVMLTQHSESFMFENIGKSSKCIQKVHLFEDRLSFPAQSATAELMRPWFACDSYQDFNIPS